MMRLREYLHLENVTEVKNRTFTGEGWGTRHPDDAELSRMAEKGPTLS